MSVELNPKRRRRFALPAHSKARSPKLFHQPISRLINSRAMPDAASTTARESKARANENGESASATHGRWKGSAFASAVAAIASSGLLILAFPNSDYWPLAWLGLVPLLAVIALKPSPRRSFFLGWLTGAVFFYGSCYWLTYSMIHYGGIPRWAAYLLLAPVPIFVGLFPGFFAFVLARAIRAWGTRALFLAPLIWSALEWARLALTGQLWNAIGYSQAYQPLLIQPARWGGVYAIGFMVVFINAAVAFLVLKRDARSVLVTGLVFMSVALVIIASQGSPSKSNSQAPQAVVVALQPNVPMDIVKSNEEIQVLIDRHVSMSETALHQLPNDGTPRLVIWPESPMNFAYGDDSQLRELLLRFATANQTAVLLNSQEAAPNDGIYNSAVMVNQQGSLIAQYDKIRLMPFGEYVPLPRWLPGASLVGTIVGDFTPGTSYSLMHVGSVRAGVFICIESAYPSIARSFTRDGADVLINISNDGYLGPTAVMRQHLANAVIRAVENGRPILRVTNSGISAYITSSGEVKDSTEGFETGVRTWMIARNENASTFYTRRGDVFVVFNAAISLLLFAATFWRRKLKGV
ncbi:MAG: apolipoprotein N-acyltransferase [Pyrinomonadaceae bacterium]|nr:apolipoprotein N-acyltransferase [Pyrinomonadaceae bacterium]